MEASLHEQEKQWDEKALADAEQDAQTTKKLEAKVKREMWVMSQRVDSDSSLLDHLLRTVTIMHVSGVLGKRTRGRLSSVRRVTQQLDFVSGLHIDSCTTRNHSKRSQLTFLFFSQVVSRTLHSKPCQSGGRKQQLIALGGQSGEIARPHALLPPCQNNYIIYSQDGELCSVIGILTYEVMQCNCVELCLCVMCLIVFYHDCGTPHTM